MDELKDWFLSELARSTKAFAWAIGQVPEDRLNRQPPQRIGDWTAARHLFHLMYYEQTCAITGMRQWLGDPMPDFEAWDEEKARISGEHAGIQDLLAKFHEIRAQQIAMLHEFTDADWRTTRETIWGPVTLRWVVTKTYQHTAEHTNAVLRMALFWDMMAEMDQSQE